MTISWSSSTYNEFSLEALRIDEMIWEALAIEPRTEIVFCGYHNSRPIIDRALSIGAKVAVIDSQAEGLRAAAERGLEAIRASTTNIPIRNERFAFAIAHYYLHEVDPTYHTQIIFELGRIARRVGIVEPGPPSDLLGSRIASLYSRAKRRLGQFEQYQSLEYWRRLLLGIRAHVHPAEIRYAHLPPKEFLHETMAIILDSVKIAGAPTDDLNALRGVAAASDSQLVPQPRYVLLAGNTAAEIPERPRFFELQSQAPSRETLRLRHRQRMHPDLPDTPAGTYTPFQHPLPPPKPNLLKRGLSSWFQPPAAPYQPPPLALPKVPTLAALPGTHPPGGARKPESSPTHPSIPAFGIPTPPEPNPLNALFSVPDMPGSDSMDWSEESTTNSFGPGNR